MSALRKSFSTHHQMFKSSIPSAHNPQLMHSRQADKNVKDISPKLSTVQCLCDVPKPPQHAQR